MGRPFKSSREVKSSFHGPCQEATHEVALQGQEHQDRDDHREEAGRGHQVEVLTLLTEQLRASQPEIKVLFISGYADDAIVRHGILHDQVNFLQKPFAPPALALKVREVLDSATQGDKE